jgi:hypothetical protein
MSCHTTPGGAGPFRRLTIAQNGPEITGFCLATPGIEHPIRYGGRRFVCCPPPRVPACAAGQRAGDCVTPTACFQHDAIAEYPYWSSWIFAPFPLIEQ